MIDFTKPYEHIKTTAKVQRCPVCEGRGLVCHGFYNPYATHTDASTQLETCRSCGGSGIIRV